MGKQKVTKEDAIQLLSKNRVELDKIDNTLQKLLPNRYVSLAKTSLELGRMYLGEVELDLGKEYPYEKTKEATKPQEIQPALDVTKEVYTLTNNTIVDVNKLRGLIDEITKESINTALKASVFSTKSKFVTKANIASAYTNLKESRMWLGKYLGFIRDNNLTESQTIDKVPVKRDVQSK